MSTYDVTVTFKGGRIEEYKTVKPDQDDKSTCLTLYGKNTIYIINKEEVSTVVMIKNTPQEEPNHTHR